MTDTQGIPERIESEPTNPDGTPLAALRDVLRHRALTALPVLVGVWIMLVTVLVLASPHR